VKESMFELLFRSLDGELTADEQQMLDKALLESPDLRLERDRLSALRQTLGAGRRTNFEPFLAERVLRRIQAGTVPDMNLEGILDSLMLVFRRVAVVGAVIAVAVIAFNLSRGDGVSLNAALAIPEDSIDRVLDAPLSLSLE
jgi:anti-sigma factor RsiW